jgi:hypothetical protein
MSGAEAARKKSAEQSVDKDKLEVVNVTVEAWMIWQHFIDGYLFTKSVQLIHTKNPEISFPYHTILIIL